MSVSRRGFLTGAAGVGGVAVGAGAARVLAGNDDGETRTAATPPPSDVVSFYGDHQAGIATPAQERMVFASFDVTTTARADLVELLKSWTEAGAHLVKGSPVGAVAGHPMAPPVDTGEAEGLAAANLTLTVGFGPSLFDRRFGLEQRRPAALRELPALPGDELDPDRSGGDLCVQACADDAQVAFHAVRNLLRLGRGSVVMRWCQLGFGRTSTTSRSQSTPRNLMGFKDGTNNIRAEDTADLSGFVWVGQGSEPAWMRGGTYLVARRIRMLIESWDRDRLEDQEAVFGRQKVGGGPLTGTNEHDKVDLAAKGPDGMPVIATNAHIRLAAPSENGGRKILRRGYSFTDGMDPLTGQLDAGLFFVSFQNDPETFVRLQRRLGASDALNEYIKHVGSAVFACPPGVRPGGWWGQGLFG
ncbi:iron uptake transporter deferrochelatase/peroxidase subunit [Actinopolymorpha pittospori]|uniref:Deferrochelatase n=1 Tax=Actinopolymorpha pittospori TaxID=648752 RepID=A0A927MYB7_9ACTN|nr:deferrochelatase/peroxidase EfeB [Actinopolymorpha pittospori]